MIGYLAAALAYLLAGAPAASAGETEAYQHLTERMDLYLSGNQPRLIESYAPPYPPGPDGTVERLAFTYDNALAVTALVARGTADDLRRARLICDALLWYQDHDPLADGRLRQAYRADGDLTAATRVKLITGFAHSYTGDLTWAGLALLTYFQAVRDPEIANPLNDPNAAYLQAAISIRDFLIAHERDAAQPGWYLGDQETSSDITVGMPIADYATLTTLPQQALIPLAEFAERGLNLQRLRAVSLLFNAPGSPVGTITLSSVKLVNVTTGQSLTIDDFSDLDASRNALGFLAGSLLDPPFDPAGKVLHWNSADGSIDYWYSLLVSDPAWLSRLDGGRYTHLQLDVAGAVGGEQFTVELQGYPSATHRVTSKSTEHNLDAYVFFKRLAALTGSASDATSADEAKRFVEDAAWDAADGKLWAGTTDDAEHLNTVNLTLDQQALTFLALGRVSRYGPALTWADQTLRNVSDGFDGFDYGLNIAAGDPWYAPVPDGVWFEGTAQVTCAYEISRLYGGPDLSAFYLGELDRAQQAAAHTDGKGLVAASRDGLTTGFPYFAYFASEHIGATVWYIAAKRRLNLLWNTSTDAPVPYNVDNLAPVLAPIGNQTVAEGQLLQFAVSATDPEGQALTYTTSALPGGAAFNAATQTFIWTPALTQAGSYAVTFTVADAGGLTDTETVAITVTNTNQAPTLTPPGNKTVAEQQLLQFTVTATDPDGDVLTYAATPLPAGAAFGAATGSFTWTPGCAQAGTYPVTLTATDPGGLKATGIATITVTAVNCPPVVTPPGSYTVKRGATLRVDVYASDPDNNLQTMIIRPKPLPLGASWKILSLGHAQFTWKPTSSNPLGAYTFTITATDTNGLKAKQPLTVTVLRR